MSNKKRPSRRRFNRKGNSQRHNVQDSRGTGNKPDNSYKWKLWGYIMALVYWMLRIVWAVK